MKIKLKETQRYLTPYGKILCSAKGEVVNADDEFVKLLPREIYDKVEDVKQPEPQPEPVKSLDKMNLAELTVKAIELKLIENKQQVKEQNLTKAMLIDKIKATSLS